MHSRVHIRALIPAGRAAAAFLVLCAACLYQAAQARAESEAAIASSYFTIYRSPGVNMEKVERRLDWSGWLFGGSREIGRAGGVEDRVAEKLDYLFKKVKDVLDMHPRVENVKIMIFKEREELDNEYYSLMGEQKSLKSFYIYKNNTIYTTEKDISKSVMAHEMGHAVINHFFVVRVPEEIAELLAIYVDTHL
jgi:hypothetical protein